MGANLQNGVRDSIPVNDPSRYILGKRGELTSTFISFLDSKQYILGQQVQAFEQEWAEFLGVSYCVSVANGTDAIQIALESLSLESGASVCTVANAGMYATTAILAANLRPYFVDVCLETYQATLLGIKTAIDSGCKAVVLTHLFGQIVPDVIEIAKLCRDSGVFLIEDCAQAHGAHLRGKFAGSFGDLATFSFYPTKNLGAIGDGGAIVTNSNLFNDKIRSLRQYGWANKYEVTLGRGRNSRMDEIQAAFLRIAAADLPARNISRINHAMRFKKNIDNPNVRVPNWSSEGDFVAHLFCCEIDDRQSFRGYLAELGIKSDIHYPTPDYRQPGFRGLAPNYEMTNTEVLARTIVSLPCFPELTFEEAERVIEAVNSWKP